MAVACTGFCQGYMNAIVQEDLCCCCSVPYIESEQKKILDNKYFLILILGKESNAGYINMENHPLFIEKVRDVGGGWLRGQKLKQEKALHC